MREWIELFRSLGESLLEVLRAELEALQKDFATSGRHFGVAVGFFGAAVMLAFWIVGLLLFFLISLLYVWLQLWAAALIVLVLFLLTAAVLVNLGLRKLKKVENPIENVRRRVDDHLEWWQRLLAEPKTVDVTPAAEPLGRELP
ncbi:MAG TPA: phage holin family protein [Thermoanaerobaculia bacterium]|nr:phage holin family protein [Thermoanaerobaculia bacterium]